MKASREVDIHEFREHFETYLQAGDTIVLMRDGQRIGTFIPTIPRRIDPGKQIEFKYNQAPTPEKAEARWAASEKSAARLDSLLESLGITEDEWVDEFERLRHEDRRKRASTAEP